MQVHVGLGDDDADLLARPARCSSARSLPTALPPRADRAAALLPLRARGRLPGHLYSNVFVDVSLAVPLTGAGTAARFAEALELAPSSKVLFATDAHSIPEMYLLGARWWRESVARALGHIVDEGFVDEQRALLWAELILAGNARRVYRFDPRAKSPGERRKPPRGVCDAASERRQISTHTARSSRCQRTTTPLSTTRRPVRLPWLAPRCRWWLGRTPPRHSVLTFGVGAEPTRERFTPPATLSKDRAEAIALNLCSSLAEAVSFSTAVGSHTAITPARWARWWTTDSRQG